MYKISELDAQFLASLIANPGGLSSLEKEVISNDFTDPLYYEIYCRVVDIISQGKPLSYNDLKFKFKEDSLVLELIDSIKNATIISDLNIIHFALYDSNRKKALLELGEYIVKTANKLETVDLVKKIEADLINISSDSSKNLVNIGDYTAGFIEEIRVKAEKFARHKNISSVIDLPTGFKCLDEVTLGLPRQNTTVIAGGTSDGKTQLAIQISNHLAMQNKGVFYFSLEDSKENLILRLASLRTGIPLKKIKCGDVIESQIDAIHHSLSLIQQSNSLFIEDSLIDINDISLRSQFAALKQPNLSVIVIDNINLALDRAGKFGTREQEISSISKKLVSLAKKLKVSVLVLQQLNTSPDDRNKGLPITMNDLRDSKAVGHDSAITIFIHCPDKYDEDKKYSKKHTQLIVGKNRYGEVNRILDFTNLAHVALFKEGNEG